jgi:GLPGLI family protein
MVCLAGHIYNMKKSIAVFILSFVFLTSNAQRIMTEGTILYNLSVVTTSKEPEMADIFDGATLTVFLKTNQALSELKSVLLNQTIIYDGKNASAVILKESGDQKFIINLTPDNWIHYNRKYDGVTYTFTNETKIVAGFPCKQAIGKLKDGTEFTVYYASNLNSAIKGYEYQFKGLPGVALEYEVQNGTMKVKYTAAKVTFSPVPAFKFDVPKSGYRILDYKSN